MTLQVAPSTSGDDATACIAETHDRLVQLEARLSALWSEQLSDNPTLADQIAVAARYLRKAAAALDEQRLA